MLNLFSPPYPFHHLKPEVFVLLGFRKCLAYFVRQPQRNLFLSGILFIVLGQLSSLNLNWILFFMNWANSKTFRFFSYSEIYDLLLRLYQSHWLIILLLFFPLSTLFLVAVLLFAEGVNFCQKQHVLNEMWCICARYRPECLEIALRVIGFGGIIYRRANKSCG